MQDTIADARLDITAEAADEARRGVSPHSPTERFIPVSKFDLIRRLTKSGIWRETDAKKAEVFFKLLVHWRHLSYAERHEELVRNYMPFSPDADTKISDNLSKEELAEHQRAFIGLTRELLQRANFDEIPRDRIDQVLSEQNPYGLEFKVDLTDFEELYIFYRGRSTTTVNPGWMERLLRKKPVSLPIYQRLFVLLKLKPFETRVRELMLKEQVDAKRAERMVKRMRKSLPKTVTGDFIYLKLFKFIPSADLEMLFPNTQVRIRRIDKMKLSVTAGGGTTAGIVSTVAKISTAGALLANPVTHGVALAGLAAVVFRQVTSVFNTRTQYMAQLSQNLYFHNLANNHGVLALLAERGEEEDVKEEVLLYTLLANSSMSRADLGDAKTAIEQYLRGEFNVTLSFDVFDALERLLRDGIVREEAGGRLVALPPEQAARHIDEQWDVYLDKIAERDMPLHSLMAAQ
jgi:hypothetical protein